MKYIVVAALVALVVGVSTAVGGSSQATQPRGKLGIKNGVIYACVETRGGGATLGDIKLSHCHKGFRQITWNVRGPKGARGAGTPGPAGQQGPQGAAGAKGDKGDKGDAGFGTYGPVHLVNRPDTGCDGVEVWAHDTEDRLYVVNAAQDGLGYFVTRYDVHGTFTTVPGTHHPGDCGNTFQAAQTGTFNGVWTKKVTGQFDFNPDAKMPASGSWDDFIAAFFAPNGESPTLTDVSYEFDYHNTCGDHWRDAAYPYPSIVDSGHIGDC